jgi:uncharacterized MnhB-related membrane protein
MTIAFLMIAILICAILSIHSSKLIHSAIWLAGVSALLSISFYLMGAPQIAVIELSVGAGLVTVLLIFAIGVAGEEAIREPSLLPKALSIGLMLIFILLLSWFSLPKSTTPLSSSDPALSVVLWEQRGLDVLTQIVLIFAGVLGLLGLLAEGKPPLEAPMADEFIARREMGLAEIEKESAQLSSSMQFLSTGTKRNTDNSSEEGD